MSSVPKSSDAGISDASTTAGSHDASSDSETFVASPETRLNPTDGKSGDLTDTVVTPDNSLLDKARKQWVIGDWEILSTLSIEDIQHHPERAKLALLAGMGHQQLGRSQAAKELLGQASKWGCDKLLLAKVLMAGVHRNLGQALVMSKTDDHSRMRAIQHFAHSISLSTTSSGLSSYDLPRTYLERSQESLNAKLDLAKLTVVKNTNQTIHVSVAVTDLVSECMAAQDLHEAVEQIQLHRLADFSSDEQFLFYVKLADVIANKRSDKMTAVSYLQYARRKFTDLNPKTGCALVEGFISLGQNKLAVEVMTELSLKGVGPIRLSPTSQAIIQKASMQLHEQANKAGEHGHDLLLSYLAKNLDQYKASISPRTPVLIEIGTTREDVPGQGSTRKIAQFCQSNGIDFVTVDMDPHNTNVAKELFQELGASNFTAITMKGEDYLSEAEGPFDFVFLDAYDFDHGGHSELRQGRYEKFLGHRIDEQLCHQMHLDCAESVHKKLTNLGVVCVDDTWQEQGKWTAKGTLAMPYLIEHGFDVLEARNRAALLQRSKQTNAAH